MAMRSLTGFDATAQRVVNVGDPTGPSDAATKAYVDGLVSGLAWKQPVKAATTGNITLTGTQTVDGVGLVANDRVLVKDQTTGSANGVYDVKAGAWTRTSDADSAAELASATVMVAQGTVNADRSFTQTADSVTVGTTALVWAQVGGGTAYTADGQGIELSGTTFSLELAANSGLSKGAGGLALDPSTAGAGLTQTAGVHAVGAGAGITVTADQVAIDTSTVVTTPATVVRKYASNVGALVAGTPATITHNLGTKDVTVQLVEVSTGALVYADIVATTNNAVTVTTAQAFADGTFRIIVHG